MPITTANNKAVDTEDSCFLSATPLEGLPFVMPSRQPPTVQQLDQNINKHQDIVPVI